MHESRDMKPLSIGAATLGAALAFAAPAGAQSGTVVADHLNNPRQLAVQKSGTVFVAEAGRGGTKCFGTGDDAGCAGYTSGIYRVTPKPKRVFAGVISGAGPDGSFAGGLSAIAFPASGGFAGIVNNVGPVPGLGASGPESGKVLALSVFNRGGIPRSIADVAAFENSDPDGNGLDSNPYGIDAVGDTLYVADAGGNDLLKVAPGGKVSLVATFPQFGGGDAVPTSVKVGPDGAIYVGMLAESAGEGGARVYRVVPGKKPTVYAKGLTTVVGLDFDKAGNLYVAELFANTVERITPTGQRSAIGGAGQIPFPGGVAIGNDGSIYVSAYSVAPPNGNLFGPNSNGQVLRFPPAT